MSLPSERRGRFVVLDGVDGCGKTTQARRLIARLSREARLPPLHVREPGSTALGERLRELLLARGNTLSAGVETLLFAAARRQMLEELVEPALAAGRDVVCERFHPSTFAYQATAGGLDEDAVLALLHGWAGAPAPDLVIVLDLPVGEALRRRGAPTDRIEDRGPAFQERVAEGFRRYAARSAGTAIVDAAGEPGEVEARIAAELARRG